MQHLFVPVSISARLFVFGACSAVLTANAHATSDVIEDSKDDYIERVEVTGQDTSAQSLTRSNLSIKELPQSVHVVERALIDSQIAIDLTDVVRNVSGIQGKATYDPMGSGLNGDYLIRGLWSESYVNGRQTFLNIGLDPASLINVERVEVLKGTSATLFAGGYGAPNGGIINMAEKRPEDEAFTTVGGVWGSFGTFGVDIDVNQPLNKSWGFRLTADKADRDINIEDITQNVIAINPTLMGIFGDTEVIVRGRYQRLKYDYYHGLNGATESVLDADKVIIDTLVPPFRNIASDRIPTSEAESFALDVSVTHNFSDNLSGSIRSAYSKADDLNHYVFFVTDTGNLSQDGDIFDINADLTYTKDYGDLSSTTVLLVDHNNTNIGFVDTYNSAAFGTFITPISGSYETLNIGVQQEWVYTDKLRLIAGLTSSDMQLDYNVSGTPARGLDESELNWKAGVSYDITPSITPFVSISDGSRLPTPTVVASAFFVGDPELESTRQTEFGVKYQFEDYGISGSIVAFDNDLTNAAESIDFTPLQLDQTSSGVDLDLQWQINDKALLAINYTKLDAEITENDSIYNGNRPFNLPESFGRVHGQYSLSTNWIISGGVSFGDERAGGLNNSFFLESYELVDLQISYVEEDYSVRLGIDNLLDSDHFEPVMFFGGGYFDQTQPRTFMLRTTYNL